MGATTGGGRRGRGILVAAGVAVSFAAAAFFVFSRENPPDLPEVDLAHTPAAVVNRVKEAMQGVRDDPDSAQAWGRLGAALDVHGFRRESVPCYEQAAVREPKEWRWPYFIGLCHREIDAQRALKAFEDALSLKKDHVPLMVVLGDALLALDRIEESGAHYQAATEKDPRCAPAWLGVGAVALRTGDTDGAGRALARALGIAPGWKEPHRLMAQVHRRRGAHEQADRELEQADRARDEIPLPDPERDRLWWEDGASVKWRQLRAGQYRKIGRLDLAEREWRDLLDHEPASPDGHRELAVVLVHRGSLGDAARHHQEAMKRTPDPTVPLSSYAQALAESGRDQEAVAIYRDLLARQPDRDTARINFGVVLARSGSLEEGVRQLQAVLSGEPENTLALFNLGRAYESVNRWPDASRAFQKLVEVTPSHRDGWSRWALSVVRSGDPKRGLDILRKGHGRFPDNPFTSNHLAWLLSCSPDPSLRDPAESLRLARRLCQETRMAQPIFLDTLAVAAASNGDFDTAVEMGMRAWKLGGDPRVGVEPGLRQRMRRRVDEYYRARRPYHGPP